MRRFRGRLDSGLTKPIFARADLCAETEQQKWMKKYRAVRVRKPGAGQAMNDSGGTVTIRVHAAIAEIPAAAWDACAGDVNPTVTHTFLNAMEESGSTTTRTGWTPQHLSLAGPDGEITGVVPLYAKTHSYGEYIFDYGWADAYERAGGRYFPKLLSAVPFTPVPGPRLLLHPSAPAETREHLLAGNGRVHAAAPKFPLIARELSRPRRGRGAQPEAGFLQRLGQQFHWTNEGYRDFDDFLAALNSRKRKAVKKERREALARGLEIEVLTGSDLKPRHWDAFFEFYLAIFRSQMGVGLPKSPLFCDDRRADAGKYRALHGPAWCQLTSPARSTCSARIRSTAAIGAATAITNSFISSAAITRRSSSRSPAD